MALPTLVNSYEFDTSWLHTASGDDTVDRQHVWFHIVDTMTSWPTNPWTVVSSCNGVTAGSPGPGWNSIADVVRTPNISWILLESVGGQQLLFSLSSSSTRYGSMYFSPDGNLTGGTVSALPLTGNYQTLVANSYVGSYAQNQTTYTHMLHATNGELDCMFLTHGGIVWWNLFVGKVANPIAEFTQPWLTQGGKCYYGTSPDPKVLYTRNYHGWGTSNSTTSSYLGVFLGFGEPLGIKSINPLVISEGVNNGYLASKLSVPSDITGAYGMFPLMFLSKNLSSIGILGTLNDIYHVPSALTTGDTLEVDPGSPTYEWAMMGNFAFPWDGTVPIIG